MWASAITAYLHYLSFMVAFGALVLESHTLKKDMTELSLEQGWRLVIRDCAIASLLNWVSPKRSVWFG
ncbi:MAG: hypothetical protein NW214_03865 [Pseudanabaenaceae cyanobacterium bins.39]|nr:hypothetical protein [Pseudanabaenaceae cyanobacterium bins.39]